jgi:hypothetical protein
VARAKTAAAPRKKRVVAPTSSHTGSDQEVVRGWLKITRLKRGRDDEPPEPAASGARVKPPPYAKPMPQQAVECASHR